MTTDVQINDNDASILAVLADRPCSIQEVSTILETLSLSLTEVAIAESISKLQGWGLVKIRETKTLYTQESVHCTAIYEVSQGAMAGLDKIIGGL